MTNSQPATPGKSITAPPAGGDTTVVHLLRHGEVHNPDGVLYGRLPGFHLSEDGRLMAKDAARALAGRDIVRIVSSPLDRARETSEPLAETLGLPVATDRRLIEPANHFEGMTFGVGDGALHHPHHWRYLYNPLRPSWGEPYRDVAKRMLYAAGAARDAARGHEVVCVSHQLPIWVARRAAEHHPLFHRPDRRQCALGSVTSFVYDQNRLVQVTYAEPAGRTGRRPQISGA
ncbi:MAG TPA: histidine phosphatase family protein [Streptosporangiaceae bacterium]|jgi:broad specificity phosphatase PhoE